ncbi:hypothetical protein DL98DRAFT_516561 [Cadophora sp. DSE1049]|nr:hypothetical protein DL98DRAFT_516561 [Cadophora sp. DSE1049]
MASSRKSTSAAAQPAPAPVHQLRRSKRLAGKSAPATQPSTSTTQDELEKVFTLFPQLSIEIRLMIWALALPGPRVLKLASEVVWDINRVSDPERRKACFARGEFTFHYHNVEEDVALLSVNRESNAVATKALPESFPSYDPKKRIRFGPDDYLMLNYLGEHPPGFNPRKSVQTEFQKIKKLAWLGLGIDQENLSSGHRPGHILDFRCVLKYMRDPQWLSNTFPNLESILLICDLQSDAWKRGLEGFEEFEVGELDHNRLSWSQNDMLQWARENLRDYKKRVEEILSEHTGKEAGLKFPDCRMVAHRDSVELFRKRPIPESERYQPR